MKSHWSVSPCWPKLAVAIWGAWSFDRCALCPNQREPVFQRLWFTATRPLRLDTRPILVSCCRFLMR